MIMVGLINLEQQQHQSPALIKDGALYYYDFNVETILATSQFSNIEFPISRFIEEEYALTWWSINVKIALAWSKEVTKRAKEGTDNTDFPPPKFDIESLKNQK